MNLLIFGPPGAGKGTQAKIIAKKHDLIHLSSGELLRQEINASRLGADISDLLKRGQLVPDRLINQLLEKNILKFKENDASQGIIFDGYPRNIQQAIFLDNLMSDHNDKITAIINLELDQTEAISRILERGSSSGRLDDNLETITERLKIYETETKPVLDYYKQQNKLINIDGYSEIETVNNLISQAIKEIK